TGSPTIRVAPTSTCVDLRRRPRARSAASQGTEVPSWGQSSSSRPLSRGALIAHHGNKQVGNARCAHVTKRSKLLAIDPIEQQNAASQHLTLVNRLERPCGN